MKRVKRLAGILLALVMALAMSFTTYAAGETGSITIDNAVVRQTYTVYKILELESYDTAAGAYAYKAAEGWNDFINSEEVKGTYVMVDEQGYVTWVQDADAAAFAKAAQKYAAENSIGNQGITKATATTVTFTGLGLGYYLVDSSLGTLCSLDTTDPDVTIKEKNQEPTNVKTVEEDSTGNYGGKNDADIGQTVNFKSTITAQSGAQNYVFHDKMDAGLTFTSVTGITLNGTVVADENYEVKTEELSDDCTFHVVFTQTFCDTLKANDKIVISYSAVLNENAVIAGNGNKNESKLSYGEEGKSETTPSETKTYTWEFNVYKYGMKNKGKVSLKGAEFILYTGEDGSYKYAQIVNSKITGWTEERDKATKLISDDKGKIEIKGLDSDTYYLEETKAPAGYNLLKDPVTVIINDEGKVNPNNEGIGLTQNTVEVENKSGSVLPSTGGMGTTLFYVIGGILVVGAAILLVAKKRMNAEK